MPTGPAMIVHRPIPKEPPPKSTHLSALPPQRCLCLPGRLSQVAADARHRPVHLQPREGEVVGLARRVTPRLLDTDVPPALCREKADSDRKQDALQRRRGRWKKKQQKKEMVTMFWDGEFDAEMV